MAIILSDYDSFDNLTQEERVSLIGKAHAVATGYGEGAAAAACQMYDAVAEISGEFLEPAEPAEEITFRETAVAMNGTMKSGSHELIADSIGRLVKTAGMDTTLRNAIRDGAEYAWIPQGKETCAYCIMLASRGWQRVSAETLKGGHADHIHANCDCIYAVRFNSNTEYEDYKPEKYLDLYESAEGSATQEKINDLRKKLVDYYGQQDSP